MAEHITPTELQAPADMSSRPLLSGLARWWSPADASAPEAVLGYESAQPWVLDEVASESPTHVRY